MPNKDELILDIVEKTYDKLEKLDGKIRDIELKQTEHDTVVKQHAARSTASEARMVWIEDQILKINYRAMMINGGIKVIVALSAIIGFALKIYPLLVR